MEVSQLTRDGEAGGAHVRFPGADPAFVGHFPQAPVLPGVDLIDTAVVIVSLALERPLRLERLASVKFCSAVLPDEEVGFAFKAVREAAGSERYKVSGRWTRGAEKVAEMVFTAAAEAGQGGRV